MAIYLTPLLDLSVRNDAVHLVVHAHVVASGALFLAVLVVLGLRHASSFEGARTAIESRWARSKKGSTSSRGRSASVSW